MEGELINRKKEKGKSQEALSEWAKLQRRKDELESRKATLQLEHDIRELEGSLLSPEDIKKHKDEIAIREQAAATLYAQAKVVLQHQQETNAIYEKAVKVATILESEIVSHGKLSHYPSFYNEINNDRLLALWWAVNVLVKNRELEIPKHWDLDADAERIKKYR